LVPRCCLVRWAMMLRTRRGVWLRHGLRLARSLRRSRNVPAMLSMMWFGWNARIEGCWFARVVRRVRC
jgi:hypothetical protein